MYPKSIRTTTFHIHRGGRGEDGAHYIGGGWGGGHGDPGSYMARVCYSTIYCLIYVHDYSICVDDSKISVCLNIQGHFQLDFGICRVLVWSMISSLCWGGDSDKSYPHPKPSFRAPPFAPSPQTAAMPWATRPSPPQLQRPYWRTPRRAAQRPVPK